VKGQLAVMSPCSCIMQLSHAPNLQLFHASCACLSLQAATIESARGEQGGAHAADTPRRPTAKAAATTDPHGAPTGKAAQGPTAPPAAKAPTGKVAQGKAPPSTAHTRPAGPTAAPAPTGKAAQGQAPAAHARPAGPTAAPTSKDDAGVFDMSIIPPRGTPLADTIVTVHRQYAAATMNAFTSKQFVVTATVVPAAFAHMVSSAAMIDNHHIIMKLPGGHAITLPLAWCPSMQDPSFAVCSLMGYDTKATLCMLLHYMCRTYA